jgi:hypothetical protein
LRYQIQTKIWAGFNCLNGRQAIENTRIALGFHRRKGTLLTGGETFSFSEREAEENSMDFTVCTPHGI